MPGDIAVQDAPSVMRNHEEAVEHPKRERRHGEEVHRSNRFSVVTQEGPQRFAGSGDLGAFRIQRSTVRSEISKPNRNRSGQSTQEPQGSTRTAIRAVRYSIKNTYLHSISTD
jgi:hypothetical protein